MIFDQSTLLLIIVALVSIGFFFLFRQIKALENKKTDGESLKVLTQWLQGMQTSVERNTESTQKQLAESSRSLNERLDRAATVIAGVQKEVGQMSEIGRSMKDLQEFLNSPKLRGNLGEHILKELLGQFLPKESFHLQYRFRTGEIVDAAIETESGIIPIDAKFPLENFKALQKAETESDKASFQKKLTADVKKHIDDIAKKYILPDEGTIDYALMYVPSESVYYEIIANNMEITDYAHKKRVLPVSPSTFYAYMRAILMSFEGKKIEERAKTILSSLRSVKTESDKFGEALRVLTKHINDTKNTADLVNNRFVNLSGKIEIAGGLKSAKDKNLLQDREESSEETV
jgi:DNA recombination protein RmuC